MSRGEPVPDLVAILGGGKLVHRLLFKPSRDDAVRPFVTRCGTRLVDRDRVLSPEEAWSRTGCGRCERDAARGDERAVARIEADKEHTAKETEYASEVLRLPLHELRTARRDDGDENAEAAPL